MDARAARAHARLGLLASAIALAVALLAGSWMNYRAATAAVDTLNRGQADLLIFAFRDVVRPWSTVDSAMLSEFVGAQAEAGLRYVALLDADGEVMLSAGEPASAPTALTPPSPSSLPRGGLALVDLGDRVRVHFLRPLLASERDAAMAAGLLRDDTAGPPVRDRAERPSGDRAGEEAIQRTRRGGPVIHPSVIEFEPVVATALVANALRSLLLAATAASILTFAALLFWRTSERYAGALLRLEQQKRLTVLGEMSAVLAHEMRNPLASLKGHAQLLAERLPHESREKARAGRVIDEAVRLEALTSDLLDFARAGPLELRATDPVEVLRTSMADVADEGFELDTTGAPAHWMFDTARIRQALVNVLENARQASNGDPPRVRVAQENGRLVFEVRDFGPGLPAGDEFRIFDPFFTTRTNGTGLGLAVARRIAELHGGQIAASNHPAGGAVFRITLPSRPS